MGSIPSYLHLLLPRTGKVAPNAAIALDAYLVGLEQKVAVTARCGDAEIPTTLEAQHRYPQFGVNNPGAYYLVRPVAGEWPHDATVVLTSENPPMTLEVPIGSERDLAAPALKAVGAPTAKRLSHMRGTTDVLVLPAETEDAMSPLVIVTLELDREKVSGALLEGSKSLPLPLRDDVVVHAITLADTAGNSQRIPRPCGPPASRTETTFLALAGNVEPIAGTPGAFHATSDAGNNHGTSRGHFLSTTPYGENIEISFTATRLTDEHDSPIEVAFHGGFFAVTGNSAWFLYESDQNWTGWKPTPSPVGPGPVKLRVVQRGAEVSGYVNDQLAGSLTLRGGVSTGFVGVHFKGRPDAASRIEFHDFVVRPA